MSHFDITIAGELNLDLILYGLPLEHPPERELLAEHMTLLPDEVVQCRSSPTTSSLRRASERDSTRK
jgi:hypothetical protein